MKIIVVGAVEFTRRMLETITETNHQIVGVVTSYSAVSILTMLILHLFVLSVLFQCTKLMISMPVKQLSGLRPNWQMLCFVWVGPG